MENREDLRIEKAENALYNAILAKAYRRYKQKWCEERNLDPARTQRFFYRGLEEPTTGQMYVSKDEFEDCEFREEVVVSALLTEKEFALYKALV